MRKSGRTSTRRRKLAAQMDGIRRIYAHFGFERVLFYFRRLATTETNIQAVRNVAENALEHFCKCFIVKHFRKCFFTINVLIMFFFIMYTV